MKIRITRRESEVAGTVSFRAGETLKQDAQCPLHSHERFAR